MNIKDRADACLRLCEEGLGKMACEQCVRQALQAAREEGNEELKKNFKHWTDVAMKEGYAKGFSDAVAKAAETVEHHLLESSVSLAEMADEIRTLKPETQGDSK